MKCFAIVPAKSRSTRLPGKNIKELAGIPMVVRVIDNLKKSKLFDQIWVSTDCEDIASICEKAGSKVLIRPKKFAQDTSTLNDVCLHWLDSLDNKPDYFCCTYATSVFLTSQDYRNAYSLITDSVDGVMGVSQFNYPPVQAMIENENGHLSMLMPDYERVQSQFYPKCLVSNGSQYWVKTKPYLIEKTFYLEKLVPFETDEYKILDINTEYDFIESKKRAAALGWNG